MANPPLWSNVKLRLTMDGANGGTSWTDLSNSAHPIAHDVVSGSSTSTSVVKFGTASTAITGNGWLRAQNTLSDFGFGTGQFTVEMWVYFTSAPTGSSINIFAGNYSGSSSLGWDFGMVNGSLAFYYSTTGTDNNNVGAAYTPALNTWIHFAVDRDASNVLRVYANGVVIASATVTGSIATGGFDLAIGNDVNTTRAISGYIDDLRIVKGEAVYGGAFTPPTAALPAATTNTTWSTTDKSSVIALSGGNLTATQTSTTTSGGVRAADGQRSGKYYWEYTSVSGDTTHTTFPGIARVDAVFSPNSTGQIGVLMYSSNNFIEVDGSLPSGSPKLGAQTSPVLVGIALDLDNRKIWFRAGAAGNWNGSATDNPATNVGGVAIPTSYPNLTDIYPYVGLSSHSTPSSMTVTANFGDSAFTGTVPSGFTSGFPTGGSTNIAAVTQLAVEQWAGGAAAAQITQLALEQWTSVNAISGRAIVTIVAVEEWAKVTATATGRKRRRVSVAT